MTQENEHLMGEDPSRRTNATEIAIVGMACRFPGAADYGEYWQNLVSRKNCIREIPPDRWSWQRYFGDPRVEPNKTGVKWGGFIDDLDKFDPLFFGIAPNEAAFIDPQHRLFLETAWHAVEDAGYSIASLSGKAVGVYAGVSKNDYGEAMRESRYEIAPYVSTGTVHSILTNRVSFLFNLRGRSEPVDTACSSALVALHNAIRDIGSGECEAAIVGGVNALITPTMFISHSKSGMLSPDGQCRTFSADANGYVRGEGVGVLFIKPLHKALSDGDFVHAVIRSSAVNHGGRANFLTSPTTEAQADVVMKALRRGNIDPRTIDYIEAHGTGTALGDPIEINGLKKAFAQLGHRSEGRPHCAIGSAKTNVGHLESAAGMAGIIKVVLSMKHHRIPGIRNFDRLNPFIELEGSPFHIATETMPWETKDEPRRAGVSSFGMGGVNAHVVLEEAPQANVGRTAEKREHVFVLSAKKGRLKPYAESLREHLVRHGDDLSLRDVAFTLQTGRDVFEERLAVTASSVDELIGKLGTYPAGGATEVVPNVDRDARRIPLPTYPFARKRCWFTDVPSRVATVAQNDNAGNADNNDNADNADNAGNAVKTLRPTDFFIRDHVVQGKPMLPGVVHLELARSATQARVLKDVYWMTPVVVGSEDVDVEVRMTPAGFELVQNGTVHSKGTFAATPVTSRRVDLSSVRARCTAGTGKVELYALLKEHGLAYGNSFQVIETFAHNEREIIAELKLQDSGAGDYVLHPGMMDGVFQTVTALSILGLGHRGRQFVPFHLETIEIASATGAHCFVHATVRDGRASSFDAVLCDADGNVLVEVRNLQKRPIAELQPAETMPRDAYYRPVWRAKELDDRAARATKPLLLFADDEAVIRNFKQQETIVVRTGAAYAWLADNVYQIDPRDAADYERLLQELANRDLTPTRVAYLWGFRGELDTTIYGVLHFTRAAFKARLREVRLAYVHPQGALHAMIGGFARTLKYENPKFDYVTVGVDESAMETIDRAVDAELGAASKANALREVVYRDGRRYERTIVRDTVTGDVKPSIQPGGVYIVSGGAGGLGSVFSRYLAEKHQATILWLGRSAMTPAIAAKIAEVERAGGRAEYFSADIRDRDALDRVYSGIKAKYPAINGVIHAAGLIEDAFILRKERDSFARVIEPKILGAMHLDALTQHEPLDFFVVFSSVAALMPNQGQCDYAAANSFLDGFVEARNRMTSDNQRSGVSLALNWPLWANGGMRVAPEEERHLLKVFGMKPLPTDDGLALFETALALAKSRFPEIHQFIAIAGDRKKIERSLGVTAEMEDESLVSQLQSIFAARLGVVPETIAGGRTIGELGIDSAAVLGITQDINKRFDADLKPTLLFDINTVDKLAAYLVRIGKDRVAVSGEAPRWNRSLIDVERSDPARRTFSRTFRTDEFYLRDHVVDGQYNMPGACYVEMARQAGDLLLGDKCARRLLHNYWVSQLSSPEEDFTAHVELTPKQDLLAYEVVSFTAAGERRLHAMGEIAQAPSATQETRIDIAQVQSRCDEIQQPEKVYEQIHGEGLIVGPTFQPMKQIFLNDAEALGMLELPEEIRGTIDDYVLNPALLTGAFQTALVGNRRSGDNSRKYIPIGMDELEVLAPIPAECWIYSRPRPANARNEEIRKFDVEICRADGVVVVRMKGFSIRALRETAAVMESRAHAEHRSIAEHAESFIETHGDALEPHAMAAAPAVDSTDDVRTWLRSLVARPIGLPADEIDFSTGFDLYGVNSVMVVELNEIFEKVFGPLSKTLFFEYRSVDELAGYFLEEHRERALAAAGELRRLPAAKPVGDAPAHSPTEGPAVHALPGQAPAVQILEERHDIAIVSAAGRFPGAHDLEEFWDVLKSGRDCITEIPPGRFDYRRHYDADPARNGIYGKWGGFIDDVDRFDPGFFNIAPREAELIDPQERLLLEVVWEMLERAGYTRQRLHKLSDRRVGVFVGALWQPYESAGIEATLAGNVVGPSSLLYSIANRISYFFDLTGPSMAIDTACSSSLTALHLACQSIRDGESQFAIAAGVNLSLSASKYLFLSRFRFLSTDGRCRSYGAGGDGYVPGEGICSLLLKPLSKAVADGDSILAVIKGSAINHGGRTNGYTVPNPKSQRSVIAQALEHSGIDPRNITYIEGHGTGTSLGDPIEIAGLEKALGLSEDGGRVCAIGSVKSNIGHLEAAAGIASIIKVLLQMENGQLAPSLHADELNPNIDFGRSGFRVQRELAAWPGPRCAGVSSFGAGGSNAHVILDQIEEQPALASGSHAGSALCVFSAKDEERLFALAARFLVFLRDVVPDRLHDIAYTLQLGREAMRERLAIVANSVEELRAALTDVLDRRDQGANWRRGRATKGAGSAVGSNDLLQVGEAWVRGSDIDWARFYGARNYRFLPLPTYPFAKERCWLDMAASEAAVLHPLVHRNASDANGQRYSTTFTGEEFFLADHRVRADGVEQKILPGVAYLEIARAAIEQALPAGPESTVLELLKIVWMQPFVVEQNKQIHVSLKADGVDQIGFEIFSEERGQQIVHCQGRAVRSRESAPARLEVELLARQMGQGRLQPNDIYGLFAQRGLLLGPSFRPVTAIELGTDQLLAHLRLPEVLEAKAAEYGLHPSLMDGALHGSIGMIDGWFDGPTQTRMPFALESLQVLAPCTPKMFAWMRYSSGSRPGDPVAKLDVDLSDEQGRVCVRMKGFASRAMKERPADSGLVTLAPVWDAVQVEADEVLAGRVVIAGGDEEQHRAVRRVYGQAEVLRIDALTETVNADARIDHIIWILPASQERTTESLIEAQDEGVLAGFRLIQALLAAGYGASGLAWTVITSATQRVSPAEPVDAAHGSVLGLVGSMAKEYRNWKVRLLDVAGSVWPWDEMLRLRADERGDAWAHRDGQWFRRRLVPCEFPVRSESGFKRGGVYVVIGGAGGVGEVLTEHLIRGYDARVVWIGRRQPNDDIARKQQRVAAGGEPPLYITANARNREELERASREIKDRYGRIDGVIHSAIVLSDKSLANMAEEQFREALATKVETAVRLEQVFGREPLDFILYFSSLQSFLKAPGQSNYAAGCTFTDSFAEWQAASAAYPVKVMNWGYWGTIGVVAAAEYQERMARHGWGSLEPDEGMAGIERLLTGPFAQIGMLRTKGNEALRALGVETAEMISVAREQAPSVCERLTVAEQASPEVRSWEEQRRGFDGLLVKMLRGQLAEVPRVAGEYERWLEESLRILGEGGVQRESPDALWTEWEAQKSRWDGMTAEVALVETTLRSLGAILRGEKRATDVIFPNSSLSLVEGVYKNNALADSFNRVMADVVCSYVEARRGTKLRLMELGAGTGGSSEGILQKLDAYRDDVAEYCYTDVSKVFLLHGERAFGAGRDYLKYAIVDVERGLQEQSVARGAYDVVLAANVLHATKRLRETLRNAKAALKANGLLVLNEITSKSVFMHLTFGLLSGWWAYEDAELRMDGSPGLTMDTWKRVLEEEGFRGVSFPARDAQGLGQQIIVAESDGIIRQKQPVAMAPRMKSLPAVAPAAAEGLQEQVEAWLIEAVGVLLKIRREGVDLDVELSELGFDSLSLTAFANHANQAFALELMPTIFFEHPTARGVARYLVEKHGRRLAERLGNVGGRLPAAADLVSPATRRHPSTASDELRAGRVEAWLVEAIGGLLKIRREGVDLDAELSDFGFDSLSLTGFANHVNQALALDLMPTIFFEHPTVRRFARYLVETHGQMLTEKFGDATAVPTAQPVVKARTRVEAEVMGANEAIAIIGMSGRFPGADDLDAFWENLEAGRESVREIPRERWDWRALGGDENSGAKWGAFMDGVDRFDPLFFGISPREAERMDPQHRLAMMYGWKAFEDAGYGLKQLWGSRTGVFIGTTGTGYSELVTQDGAGTEGYTATGIVPSVGPNRISFTLNLHGPSEPIETACSSSLVAVNRAVRSMMAGECEMALVGGVNTLFPTLHMSFNKSGMLSPDGKCKTFSSRADGYARGEGVGMLVLKKLSAAERDGDHIYALIRGTAENHGGRAQSLTAPNPIAQAELLKDAYRRAGVSPKSVSYIEAHGTGTPLGDPIEINGLKMAFQALYEEIGEKPETGYCGLGSVKPNIGHLELAAGMAGLIKLVLQLQHKTLVRTLHCEEINPYIRLEESPFYIVRENRPWKRLKDGAPLRAGVSSFGFGGVNAHVVVEEYAVPIESAVMAGPVMIVLSARDAVRLKEQATQLRQWIARNPSGDLTRIAYTLQVGREAMEHRLAMTVASMKELEAKLDDFLAGKSAIDGLYSGEVKRNSETLALFRGDEELREAVEKWIQRGKWAKLLELWVKGLEIEWEQMYGDDKPRRISLPTYPFAQQRCWIDATVRKPSIAAEVLHPLLHRNISDLTEQLYSSTFTGEEFFLSDHQIRNGHGPQKVLPGVAYLEMARAAVKQASRNHASSILELHDVVWVRPIIVTEPKQVSITLSEKDEDRIDYEIYSGDADQQTVHCQGQAVFSRQPAPARLDLEQLRLQMSQGRMDASQVYAMCDTMGLHYGPTHRGITAIHLGETQLLAELRLPAGVEQQDYVLHPSVMDSALQASLGLFVDLDDLPGKPSVPFGMDSIRILSASTREMAAWVRYAQKRKPDDKTIKVDIDLCDAQGNVCMQIRGLASRVLDGDAKASLHRVAVKGSVPFDDVFYDNVIADVISHKVSIDDAADLE